MLKSILSVFSGALGMILKVMLVILLVFIAGYCLFSMLTMPFVWGGVIRTGIIAVCAFLIRFLLRLIAEDLRPLAIPEAAPEYSLVFERPVYPRFLEYPHPQ